MLEKPARRKFSVEKKYAVISCPLNGSVDELKDLGASYNNSLKLIKE